MEKNIRSLKTHRTKRSSDRIEELAQSIRQVGVLQPVLINRQGDILSGKRRVQAATKAGLKRIPAIVYDEDKALQEVARLDANLMVLPLGDVEFDQALHRRKQLWEQLYPDTKQHVAGGKQTNKSFARETSKRLGVSRRTIEKAVSRVERSSPTVSEARGRGLTASKADELSRLPRQDQNKLLNLVEKRSLPEVRKAVRIAAASGSSAAIRFLKNAPETNFIEETENQIETLMKSLNQAIRGEVKYDLIGDPKITKKLHQLQVVINSFIELHEPLTQKRRARTYSTVAA